MFNKIRKAFKRDKNNDLRGRVERFKVKYNALVEEEKVCWKHKIIPLKENQSLFQVTGEIVDCTKLLEQLAKKKEEAFHKKCEEDAEVNIAKENKESK